MGRLLITFMLVCRGVLHRPLLYLSYYLKRHRAEYYDRLTAVRLDGDWEGWLRFFLQGVAETAAEATSTAGMIVALRERDLVQVSSLGGNGIQMLDHLYRQPLLDINAIVRALDVSYPTANKLAAGFVERGILNEVTGHRRNRVFRYSPYLAMFDDSLAAPE